MRGKRSHFGQESADFHVGIFAWLKAPEELQNQLLP
jgi:hypothetical protein